jgi:hypothetical protein
LFDPSCRETSEGALGVAVAGSSRGISFVGFDRP